jgi:hypothetical protein
LPDARVLGDMMMSFRRIVVYVGACALPLVMLLGWRVWLAVARAARTSWLARAQLGVGAAVTGWFAWTTPSVLRQRNFRMPFHGSFNLADFGLGPATLHDVYIRGMPHLPTASPDFFWKLTWLGVAGGALLVGTALVIGLRLMLSNGEDRAARTAAASALAFIGGNLLILVAIFFYDRYFVPLLPLVAVASGWSGATPGRTRLEWMLGHGALALALAGVVAIGGFSVAATHDYLAWNRARWQLLRQLTDGEKIPPSQIDGGFEFNGFLRYGSNSKPGKSWWWVEDDRYLLSFGPVPGFTTYRAQDYSRWLGGRGQVLVLRRN